MNVEFDPAEGRWTREEANLWRHRHPWLCGFNFLPSTACNFLEMWRADTFDAAAIDRELGWAAAIGFNALRTNLHYLDWRWDREGLIQRVEQFLAIASSHGITSMLTLFDDCEFSGYVPSWAAQPEPRPGLHNSCAIGSPGRHLVADRGEWPQLKEYVQGIVGRFADDPRVLLWDLYNEPGNRMIFDHGVLLEHDLALEAHSHALMRATFAWAREIAPSQPLTVAPWRVAGAPEIYPHPIDRDALDLSDIVSFHAYCTLPRMMAVVGALETLGRPLMCTEWMARPIGSRIDDQLPFLRAHGVSAFQWGLVRGRSQTFLPWPGFGIETAVDGASSEWFHDILTEDGQPFCPREVELIRTLVAGEFATAPDGAGRPPIDLTAAPAEATRV